MKKKKSMAGGIKNYLRKQLQTKNPVVSEIDATPQGVSVVFIDGSKLYVGIDVTEVDGSPSKNNSH